MSIQDRLNSLDITLPAPPKPAGAYVPCVRSGSDIFVSGHIPVRDGKVTCSGKVGSDVDLETAQEAARTCILNGLAALQAELGDLDAIKQIVRIDVFVNSAPGFTDQPQVANGASNLLQDIFGDAGVHARMAIGAAELPLDVSVEIALIARV